MKRRVKPTSCYGVEPGNDAVKAKFHYAVQLASRSQTSSRPNSITLSSLRAARELVSQAGSRAASELDEDMRVYVVCLSQAKFHYATKFHYQIPFQLASRSATVLASKIA